MIRFGTEDNFIEIDLASQEEADLPSRGDAYVTVKVQSHGFSGHNDLWLLADSLRSFCAALVSLEAKRQGEARIEGISPGELDLRIFSVDRLGHMAVEGITGYGIQSENAIFPHSVRFGLEFDPSQLVAAVRVPWVKRNAEP